MAKKDFRLYCEEEYIDHLKKIADEKGTSVNQLVMTVLTKKYPMPKRKKDQTSTGPTLDIEATKKHYEALNQFLTEAENGGAKIALIIVDGFIVFYLMIVLLELSVAHKPSAYCFPAYRSAFANSIAFSRSSGVMCFSSSLNSSSAFRLMLQIMALSSSCDRFSFSLQWFLFVFSLIDFIGYTSDLVDYTVSCDYVAAFSNAASSRTINCMISMKSSSTIFIDSETIESRPSISSG